MQILLEFIPIFAFFIAYKMGGIFVATATLIVVVIVQATIQWVQHRKISPMMMISAVLVLVFGGITLILKDKTFIQWKPTVLYWLFAIAFVVSRFIGDKPIIERLLGENITLERSLWTKLNTTWAIFFVFLGCVNLYVAYHYDEATWVNFKLFGLMGLMLVFTVAQGFWLTTKMPPDSGPDKPST
jgi:intracellular septation protein